MSDIDFEWADVDCGAIKPAENPKKPAYMVKKLLPEYVWDITEVEDNPYTFVDVQTLLQGHTVAGHTLFDQQQALNQAAAINHLLELLESGGASVNADLVLNLHAKVAKEEALGWGELRQGQVAIGGTVHKPPAADRLNDLFAKGLKTMNAIQNPVERALVYYFWGSQNQFFYDGNKRTSRLVMNYMLMQAGYYYLSVPGAKKDEFNQMMVRFYDSKDASEGMTFMVGCYKNWD